MISTLVMLVVAVFLYLSGMSKAVIQNVILIDVLFISIPCVLLLVSAFAWISSWPSLQQGEQQLTPRISNLFLKDFSLRMARAMLLLFLIYSLTGVLFVTLLGNDILLLIWLVLFGVALDSLHYLLRRISGYFDPFRVVVMFGHQANKSIQQGKEQELLNWIEALAEVGFKAVQRSNISLVNNVCNELQRTARIFLEASKSIAHIEESGKKTEGSDEVSYTIGFILQRLEMINDKAAEIQLEAVCSNVSSAIGKIAISAAKCDISLPAYPIYCLGRSAVVAVQHGLLEVGTKATFILLEVAKGMVNDIDITYAELQEPFFSLVAQLNEIAREMFKQDKSISIKVLMQPFRDLKELFSSEKLAGHPDTPAILKSIDAVIQEYDTLETVMRTIPPIPPISQDEK